MQERYSGTQQALHWATLVLFLVQLWTYPAIARTHHAPHLGVPIEPLDLVLHQIHALSGGIILLFVGLRLWLRFRHPIAAPSFPMAYFAKISNLTHIGIYTVLILLPITGFLKMYIISIAGPVHVILTRVLYALIVLHIGGALVHVIIWRDGLLERMGIKLPFQRAALKQFRNIQQ
ncbi:MAG: cytochrome b/b6 domain-containing protein [Beijerinckiaceae bacterium]|nr:cytochrome b/b6 domain-containing protein [Beijerinckiaceae bacterium]